MTIIEILDFPSAVARARGWLGQHRRAYQARRDALLHPWRLKRARARLGKLSDPGAILVLCMGNVCRSPYAEERLRRRLDRAGRPASVVSAGFIGPGRPADDSARRIALERGVDLSGHESTLVDEALTEWADLILLVEPSHAMRLQALVGRLEKPLIVLGDLDPWEGETRVVRDPWGQDDDVFQRVFDRLDRCIDALVEALPGGSLRPEGSPR